MPLLPRGVSAATTGDADAAAAADTTAAIGTRGMGGLEAAAAGATGCWDPRLPAAGPGVVAAVVGPGVVGMEAVDAGGDTAAAPLVLPGVLLPLPPVGTLLLLLPKPRLGVGSGMGPAGMPKGGGTVVALRGDGPTLADGAAAVAAADGKAEAELVALPAGVQEAAGCEAAAAAAARVPKVTPLAPAKPAPAPAACG